MNLRRKTTPEVKQVIILRSDLGMGKGKLAAQASHASVLASLKARESQRTIFDAWMKQGMKKVVLKVSSEEALMLLFQKAIKVKIPCSVVNDAGLTQLPPGTATSVAIGPAIENLIDPITGGLKLL